MKLELCKNPDAAMMAQAKISWKHVVAIELANDTLSIYIRTLAGVYSMHYDNDAECVEAFNELSNALSSS